MKFAFSTAACPTWDLPAVVARAAAWGYHGVELCGRADDPGPARADPWAADPDLVRQAFAAASVEIVCLSTSVAMTGHPARDAERALELRGHLDVAGRLGCPLVRVADVAIRKGQNRDAVAVALGDWLLPLGDYAAAGGVTLAIDNAAGFRLSRPMWGLLDRISHPAIACCWDVCSAAQAGEGPAVSVPTLNSKIACARARDARLTPGGAAYCALGAGDVDVRDLLTRLRGIGYGGYVSVGWERAWGVDPEAALPDALAKLRRWGSPSARAGNLPVARKK